MALSAPRKDMANKGPILLDFGYAAKASKVFYGGALVATGTDGYLVPAAATPGLTVVGVLELENHPSLDTTGQADGFYTLATRLGIFPFKMGTSADAVTIADVGHDVFVIDDTTIARIPTGGRPKAGKLFKVEVTVAWVGIGIEMPGVVGSGAGTAFQGTGSIEAISAAGPLSVNTEISTLAVTGTTAYTLANGLFAGQKKYVTVISGATTPAGTVTPATTSGFTAVSAFGALGDAAVFIWTGTAWIVGPNSGVTVA